MSSRRFFARCCARATSQTRGQMGGRYLSRDLGSNGVRACGPQINESILRSAWECRVMTITPNWRRTADAGRRLADRGRLDARRQDRPAAGPHLRRNRRAARWTLVLGGAGRARWEAAQSRDRACSDRLGCLGGGGGEGARRSVVEAAIDEGALRASVKAVGSVAGVGRVVSRAAQKTEIFSK